MTRLAGMLVLALLLAGCGNHDRPSPVSGPVVTEAALTPSAPGDFSTNSTVPLSIVQFVQCALNGAGEFIAFDGRLHIQLHFSNDGHGGYHSEAHFNNQGVRGVGLTSGETYQYLGVTEQQFHAAQTGLPIDFDSVINVRIIGRGTASNFLLHETLRGTVDVNHEMTVVTDHLTVDCK